MCRLTTAKPSVNTDVLARALSGAHPPELEVSHERCSHSNVEPGCSSVFAVGEARAEVDPSRGAAYDERADRRSWEAMKTFLTELTK